MVATRSRSPAAPSGATLWRASATTPSTGRPGGVVNGRIDLGPGDDRARLSDLTDAELGALPLLTGGVGDDSLAFSGVRTGGVSRLDRWERIDLTNASGLRFDGGLVLGDEASGTGVLTVAPGSALFGGGVDAGVRPFVPGARARLEAPAAFDLTSGVAAGDVAGSRDYVGSAGLLLLDTTLGSDGAPSDRLVIDGGAATGATGIAIRGEGQGDATTGDGILVVAAENGATTGTAALG